MMKKTTNKINFLRQFPLFDMLKEEEMNFLTQAAEFKTVSKYGFIYLPDDISNSVFFLIKGTVKIGTHSDDGREVIKSIIHPTAMFGELGLVGEEKRKNFARAMNESAQLCILKVADFQRLMQSNHKLSLDIISIIGDRLRRAENRLESLIFKDARTRIIDFIKDCIGRRGRRIGYEMLLKHSLTQQDIANLTGTSRQTVTSVLNDLKKSDLIYFNRRSILVRDMARLA
ncbi:MAG: Crp/Fnr family transcriptional regulator [Saprospiraceae bacterium]